MEINNYNKYNGILTDNQELLIDPFLSTKQAFRITLKQLREFVEDNLTISPGGTETDPIWTADKPNYLTSATASATYSLLGHTHTFASLTSIPTTLAGYGITDAYPLTGNPSGFLTTEHTGYNLKTTGATIGAGLTVFYDAYGTSTFSASEVTKASVNQFTGTVKELYVHLNTAQPGTGSLVITLRENTGAGFANTTTTLTIAAGSAAGIYSVTGLSTSITAGSLLTYRAVNNAAGASGQLFSIGMLIQH